MGKKINKTIIYTNQDNQDFTLDKCPTDELSICLEISDCPRIYFLSSEEVDEFCELLQQKKKETWKK